MRTYLLAGLIPLAIQAMGQNDCSTALPISASTYVVAVMDGAPAQLLCVSGTAAEAAEWYSYTPTEDRSLTITTNLPVNSGKDTRFHVYTGPCGSLTCVSGNDDVGGGLLSEATFNVYAGVTYIIAFDDRWDNSSFVFKLEEGPPMADLLSFTQQTLPISGSIKCVVDMNGDFLDDVVRVSATMLTIAYQGQDGTFTQVTIPTDTANFTPSWSIAAGDIDGNGYNDLLYGGGQGVTFMIANDNGTAYTEVSGPEYVFSQRSNFVDINNDGELDAFVCHDVLPNVFYLNDGSGTLEYNQGGLGDTPDGGNYGSIWIDHDNDGDLDLFIAKCRGGNTPANINQLHRNNGDGTYTEIAASLGLADNIQTWSSAWGDYDNDGDLDIMIGAYSFVNGGHKLIRNDGNGVFTDVTAGSGFDELSGTGVENVTHDFNNDGYLDIFGAGGEIMMNNGDFTFTPAVVSVNHGPIGDLNDDGFLDIVNNGTAHMNVPNGNNWIKFNVIGSVSNYNGIGARIQVTSAHGSQIREVRSGEGFGFMSTLNVHFGLAGDQVVEEVVINWPSGVVDVLTNVDVNSTVTVIEGSTGNVAVDELPDQQLEVFPSPTSDILYVRSTAELGRLPVWVFDMGGRMVKQAPLVNGTMDVRELSPGVYILHMVVDGKVEKRKFTKQ